MSCLMRLEKNSNLINLVHSVEEVLLSGDLPSCPDQTEIIWCIILEKMKRNQFATFPRLLFFSIDVHLMANMPASVQTLRSSAPVELGHNRASSSYLEKTPSNTSSLTDHIQELEDSGHIYLMSFSTLIDLAWILKMFVLPSRSGKENSTWNLEKGLKSKVKAAADQPFCPTGLASSGRGQVCLVCLLPSTPATEMTILAVFQQQIQ